MPPLTLYLARHGQSEWNHRALITGRADIGLSDTGREQAESLAACLRDEPLDAIVTSALRRTAQTAEPTARAQGGLPIERLAGLDEIDLGPLEGRYRDERDPDVQQLWAQWQADLWGFRIPGAEPFADFAARVNLALDDVLARHAKRRVLLVGHRATNRVILGRLLGWPRERWIEIRPRHKYFYRLGVDLGEGGATATSIASIALTGRKIGQVIDDFVM